VSANGVTRNGVATKRRRYLSEVSIFPILHIPQIFESGNVKSIFDLGKPDKCFSIMTLNLQDLLLKIYNVFVFNIITLVAHIRSGTFHKCDKFFHIKILVFIAMIHIHLFQHISDLFGRVFGKKGAKLRTKGTPYSLQVSIVMDPEKDGRLGRTTEQNARTSTHFERFQ
jgi:hypothetical protein